jgi:hypothetical protein
VANALTETRVNVSAAARSLGVPPGDLRRALAIVRPLLDLVVEIEEQRIDKAVSNLDAMLDSANDGLRKESSLFVLRTHKRAVSRGFRQPDAELNVNVSGELITRTICWGDGSRIAEIEATRAEWDLVDRRAGRRTIDGELADADAAERTRIEEERRQIAADTEEERRRQGDHDPR